MSKIIIVFDQPSWGGTDSHLTYLLEAWPNSNDKIEIYYNSYHKGIFRVKESLKSLNNINFIEYNHNIINLFEYFNSLKFIRLLNYFFIP